MTGYSTAAVGASPSAGSGAGPSATGRLLDELAGLLLPVIMPLVRRLPAMILVLAGLITLTGVLALVGAHRDDSAIDAHRAVATAQVLPGSDFARTLIAFTTAKGDTVLPERGVFYPRGLQPGQTVRVEYDTTHPDLVRVLGRTASVGTLPVGLMLLGVWLVALPVGFSLRGRQLRRIEAAGLEAKAKAVARARAESRIQAASEESPAAATAATPTAATPTDGSSRRGRDGSAPAGSAQAGSAPAGSAPAGSAHAGSAQAGSAHAGSAHAGSAQVDPAGSAAAPAVHAAPSGADPAEQAAAEHPS
jgi:hypothetical protein